MQTIGEVKMLKKWTLGLILLTTSLFSQATLITKDVNSVDMTGISVTAYFDNATSETLLWSALTSTLGGVGNFDWSLSVDGDTFGQYDQATSTFYGLWTLTNLSNKNIVSLVIDAGMKGFYFDTINGLNALEPLSGDHTPGSGAGVKFDSSNNPAVDVSYDDLFSGPDLYGKLIIDWTTPLASGETFKFITDTDKATVPEPSTLFTFALGLIALTSLRKKSSGK